MVTLIRLSFTILVLLLIVPQTPTENLLARMFHNTGRFIHYGQAKKFLSLLTWSCVFIFLLITFINNVFLKPY